MGVEMVVVMVLATGGGLGMIVGWLMAWMGENPRGS